MSFSQFPSTAVMFLLMFSSLCFTYSVNRLRRKQPFILEHRVSITYRILSFSLSDELGRVRLRFGPKQGSDYINASFIDVCSKQQQHIQAILMYGAKTTTHASFINVRSKQQHVSFIDVHSKQQHMQAIVFSGLHVMQPATFQKLKGCNYACVVISLNC